ncbi:hypothetical protein GCM10010335_59390 [Streptomyces galbus]|nr:hypothetical protein GCM10010335_59390 [Streptomyces galbus]
MLCKGPAEYGRCVTVRAVGVSRSAAARLAAGSGAAAADQGMGSRKTAHEHNEKLVRGSCPAVPTMPLRASQGQGRYAVGEGAGVHGGNSTSADH